MCAVFTVAFAVAVTDIDDIGELSLGWFAVSQLGLWVGLLVVPLVVSRTKGNGMVRDFGLEAKPRDLLVGGFWGLATQYLLVPLVYLPIWFLFDADTEEIGRPARELTERAESAWDVVLLVVIVGVIAPIVEEIFYRGLLQRSMQRRFGAWPGVVLTALLFGAAHMQLLQFPALALAGLVFGIMAHRSGRLGPAMAAHLTFNMMTVVYLVWLD